MKSNGTVLNSKDIQRLWGFTQPAACDYMKNLEKLNIVEVEYKEEVHKNRHFLIKYVKLKK